MFNVPIQELEVGYNLEKGITFGTTVLYFCFSKNLNGGISLAVSLVYIDLMLSKDNFIQLSQVKANYST